MTYIDFTLASSSVNVVEYTIQSARKIFGILTAIALA